MNIVAKVFLVLLIVVGIYWLLDYANAMLSDNPTVVTALNITATIVGLVSVAYILMT